jgi:hypothetical protein
LQYPGSGDVKSAKSKNEFVSPELQKELTDPSQIPAKKQPIVNRSDPDARILEKTGQTFKDASKFIKDSAKETTNRS